MNIQAKATDDGRILLGDITFDMVSKDAKNARGYVLSTWVRSAWDVYKKANLVLNERSYKLSNHEFLSFYPDHAERVFAEQTTWLLSRSEVPNVFHGYIILYNGQNADGETKSIHWAYVPPEMRRFGLFKAMCEVTKCQNKQQKVKLSTPWPYRQKPAWILESHPFILNRLQDE